MQEISRDGGTDVRLAETELQLVCGCLLDPPPVLACLAQRQHLSCQHQHTLLVACLATSLCTCNRSQRFTEDDHREGEEERVAESIALWWCWAGN